MKLGLLFSVLLLSVASWGQIVTFDFAGLSGSEVSATSNYNDTNLNVSTITRGLGLTASANGDRFNATNWATSSIANAVSGNDYIEFTITPKTDYQFSVSSIVFLWQRSDTGSTAIALRSSIDGFATNLDSQKGISDDNLTQTITFSFTQTNSASAVTYRLYGYSEATGGSAGPEGIGNDIVVNGNVSLIGPYSVTSGDWNVASTWSTNAVPLNSENVTISSGHTVYTNSSITRNKITKIDGAFELRDGGWASGTGTFIYNSITGTLNFNLSSGSYAVNATDVFWPTANGPYNVNVLNAGMNLNSGTNRTVNGLFSTANAGASNVSFPDATLTLNGICQINLGGAFGNSPIFGNTSTLIYNSTGTYGRGFEWIYNGVGTIGVTPGYPNNVQISNNTTFNYTNGIPLNKAIAGNLTIDSGSSFYMDYGSVSASGFLTVAGNFINNGNFTLGFAVGDDLKLGGNFTNTGNFDGKGRAIFFLKNGVQTVFSNTTLTIPYVVFQPASGSTTVQLLSDVVVSAPSGGNGISFNNSGDIFDLNSKSLTIGTTGKDNIITGVGTFKGSTTSNLTLLGNGSIGTLNFTTGSQILGNLTLNRQAATIGFDLGTDLSINGIFTLTGGIANLSNKTLIITLSGTITGGSSSNYIIADFTSGGILRKNFNATGSFTFPIGDSSSSANGSQYSPATINFTAGTSFSSGWVAIAVDDTIEPNCLGATDYISRYWNLTSSGITNATYDFMGTYLPVDLVGTETTCISTRYSTSNSSWTDGANLVLGSNTISLVGLTSATGALTSPNHFTAAFRVQEIRVERSTNALIPSGSSASTGYDTDFGTQALFSTSATKTYTIRNIGNANLVISNPVLIGANPGDFIISVATIVTISGSSTATFTVAFNPTALGTRTATVSITNNDSDENPYVFDVIGNGECPLSTNTISPTSGPVGTEVTIVSSDAVINNISSATAMFNSEPAVVTLITSTEIKVKVPDNALSGNLNVTNSLGCIVSNSFIVIDNTIALCQGNGSPRTNLFISEVSDHGSGSHSYIEIFNTTGATINLLNYTIRIHNNGAVTATSTITLPNFDLANNTAYVIAFGSTDASSNPGGIIPNLIDTASGINDNDNVRLYNSSGTWIDLWGNTADVSFTIALKNYIYRRKNIGITAPSTIWNPNDWEAFSPVDYSNIGLYDFSIGTPPLVTLHPFYIPTCKVTSLKISGEEGYNGSSPADTKELTYQWYVNVPPAIGWTAISDDLIYSGTNDVELSISDISGLINNQYYCQIREDSINCYSATNAVQITDGGVAIWNGVWINGPPTLNKLVIIDADYNTSTQGSFDACSLIVNALKTLTISSDDYTNIKNDLTVDGNLIVENSGSVIQIGDNGVNSGIISVNRIAQAKNLDYVYWSSPVSDFAVKSLPNTHHYEWNTTIANPKGTQGNWVKPSTTSMTKGKGYIARASNGATSPTDLSVTFVGVPFNGKFRFPILRGSDPSSLNDNWNLIGNPYPSALDVEEFLYENADPSGTNPVLEGAVHIWTHGTAPAKIASPFYDNFNLNYTNSDYIVYNAMGTVSGPDTFFGKIASGQGFFVKMIDGVADTTQSIIFKNSMRDKTYQNNNFYKTKKETEKHRIWLDLLKVDGGNWRTLVGYSQGATLEKDVMFDVYTEVTEMSIYSLIGNQSMIIQGRPLPFDSDDRVPIGVNITSKGNYLIAIGAVDGLFANSNQNIFLEDTKLNIIHDLKLSPYPFYSEKGNLSNRFILRYTNSNLKTNNYSEIESNIIVYTNNYDVIIKSSFEKIENITVYDVLGRQILERKNENSSEIILQNISVHNQPLFLKIKLQNGQITTRKIIL